MKMPFLSANGQSAKTCRLGCMAVALGLAVAARADAFDWAKKRSALGHQDKLRVLVDKVLSRSNNWVMTEKHVEEIRDAGFNVVVPRVGCEDMKRVRRVADMARKRGLFYMAWMRGTRGAKTGTKLVWANGGVQDLYSPNADELWDWMSGLILGHARLSTENPAIIGSFLDFENYEKGSQGNCYGLSYDDNILAEFAKAEKLELPKLGLADRHAWLKDNGHLAAFRDFQIRSWRQRCHKLRRQIDAINPRFQLIVYPRGTLFLHEAIYPEWATQQAPLIFADHCTYNRPRNLPHAHGLAINKRTLEDGMRFGSKNVPLVYISGIDPIYKEADPEFCGRNAAMISQTCDGYWIFYEGPDYHKDHLDYFEWFSRANRAIAAGRFDFWTEPRETPDPMLAEQRKLLAEYCGAAVKPYSSEPMPKDAAKTTYTVRKEAVFCVLLRAGETLNGRLQVRRLGQYTGGCSLTLYGPDRQKLLETNAELNKPTEINWAAKKAGVHVITVSTTSNPAQLLVKNQHFCLIAAKELNFISAQPPTYFLPLAGHGDVSLTLGSPSPAETAMITVFDPTGRQTARGDTVTKKQFKVQLSVPEDLAGRPLSFRLERATKGSIEDVSLKLGAGCSPFLATHPSRLLVPAK